MLKMDELITLHNMLLMLSPKFTVYNGLVNVVRKRILPYRAMDQPLVLVAPTGMCINTGAGLVPTRIVLWALKMDVKVLHGREHDITCALCTEDLTVVLDRVPPQIFVEEKLQSTILFSTGERSSRSYMRIQVSVDGALQICRTESAKALCTSLYIDKSVYRLVDGMRKQCSITVIKTNTESLPSTSSHSWLPTTSGFCAWDRVKEVTSVVRLRFRSSPAFSIPSDLIAVLGCPQDTGPDDVDPMDGKMLRDALA